MTIVRMSQVENLIYKITCQIVIFAQTIGIAFCDSLEITPFSLINTYLNIPDCKGKESLFEAENA